MQSDFYSEFDITKEQFLEFKFENGFNKGDIIVLRGRAPEEINVGDVIVFRNRRPDPIIHRVIRKWQHNNVYYFQTKGDRNSQSVKSGSLDETKISQDEIIATDRRVEAFRFLPVSLFVDENARVVYGENPGSHRVQRYEVVDKDRFVRIMTSVTRFLIANAISRRPGE